MGLSARQTATVIHMRPDNHSNEPQSSPRSDEWAECLRRVAEHKDREAFAALFGHYAPQIKSYGMSTTGVTGLQAFADELAQETMIKVWRNAASFNRQKASATTWIFTIARNARIDIFRRNARHKTSIDADDLWLESDEGAPFEELDQQRTAKTIREAMSKLPLEQSQAIGKVYLEGKSHSEVAEELDLPLGTVKSRVRLALKKMKLLVTE